MDNIVKQKFMQESREKWNYEIRTQGGAIYKVSYEIKPFGYCSEKLMRGSELVWDREFKVGEALSVTALQHIEGKLDNKECQAV